MMKRILFLLLLLFSTLTTANEGKWTTVEQLPNNDSIKFYWVGAYKGFDSIYKIEVIRNKGLVKTIRIHGQPVFSASKKYMAVKNCWYGGCRREIKLFELSNYNELQPIQMDRKVVLNLNWQGSILNIEIDAMNNNGNTNTTSIPVENRNLFVRSPN
jgi:hypothetical protein